MFIQKCIRAISFFVFAFSATVALSQPPTADPNPYERYASAANAWQHPINGYLSVYGNGTTRAAACSIAIDFQTKRIEREEATGYSLATERTDCICGSYSSMGNMNYTKPQWVCGAYHKLKDTGKARGTISR